MPRRKTASRNVILIDGVDAFPENKDIILAAPTKDEILKIGLLDPILHPRYHGVLKPGCMPILKRREGVFTNYKGSRRCTNVKNHGRKKYCEECKEPQYHLLDIYACYKCGLEHECLRSGWEIGWFGGTESKKLK